MKRIDIKDNNDKPPKMIFFSILMINAYRYKNLVVKIKNPINVKNHPLLIIIYG